MCFSNSKLLLFSSRLAQRNESGSLLNCRTSVQIRHRLSLDFGFGISDCLLEICDFNFSRRFLQSKCNSIAKKANPKSEISNPKSKGRCSLTGRKRRSHKPKITGSSPVTATTSILDFRFWILDWSVIYIFSFSQWLNS